MNQQPTPATATAETAGHPPATRALLAGGAVAGPLYVAVSLAQALTRHGFDLTRHAWSLLATGPAGWIQVTNFLLAGVLTVGLAVGLRAALRPGRGGVWARRLIGGYGLSLVAAGVFRADPALGFPPGTPDGPAQASWHGTLHFAAGGVGFTCLVVACLVLARRFAAERRRGWAAYSTATGVLFLAGFAGVASGATAAWANLGFTAAVLLGWAWLSALAAHHYRRVDARPAR